MTRYSFLLTSLVIMAACTSGKQPDASTAAADSLVVVDDAGDLYANADDATLTAIDDVDWDAIYPAREFLSDLYGGDQSETIHDRTWLESHCSAEVLQYLKDNYDYEGDGYAAWLLAGDVSGSEELDCDARVIAIGYGMYKGHPVHAVTREYGSGASRMTCVFYFGLEPKGDEDYTITYFDMTDPVSDPVE